MKSRLLLHPALLAALCLSPAHAKTISTHSPDQQLHVQAGLDESGTFRYALDGFGKPLILPSAAAIKTTETTLPSTGWKLLRHETTNTDTIWKPLWGKRSEVPDRHNQTIFELEDPNKNRLDITIRVYDDGLALRYSVPSGAPSITATDRTEFHFAGDYTSWAYNHENHNKGPENISWIHDVRSPVITLQADPEIFLAIHEADLRQGEPLLLVKAEPTAFRAMADLGTLESGKPSPWRVLFCGRSPGALVDSHLLELLNPPADGDFSWVTPGVCTWDWRIDGAKIENFTYGMNYESWVRMINFSAANGMKHLVLDANWYGPEFAKDSDPVKGDKANDVKKIIDYGKSKNVGVWLYLNDVGGRKFPLEETLAHYGEWGATGVKYGFMNGTPEEKNHRTRLITELCAKNKLLCNFHDSPVHPYGQMRTWPNAVTREFCFAQLDSKRVFEPKTFVTSVFVNMLAGPIDMNNGFFDLRQGPTTRVDNPLECPSTLVAEAARTLITFSGATVIPDIPEFYQKYPELLNFIAAQQMPWRESKTLSGVIGKHIVMARESAKGNWLVGAATNEEARELKVKLDFLPPGTYQATIVQDGEDGHYQTNRETLRVEKRKASPTDTLHLKLAPGGGACVILEKSTAP
jgi:alpha-glucosidase